MGSEKRKHKHRTEKKEKKRKKRRRRSRSRISSHGGGGGSDSSGGGGPLPPSPQLLLLAAAVGDKQRCRELVDQGGDVNYADREGTTALHEACRHGHLSAAKVLLRRGADASMADVRGDTPAHLAARHGHLNLLPALLVADHPPAIDALNARGETIEHLTAQAMDTQDVQSFHQEAHQQATVGQQGEQRQRQGTPDLQRLDEDWEWERRLAEEYNRGEQEEETWGAYGGGDWHADQYETPEEYAQRIWEEMQAHRRAQQQQERATSKHRRSKVDAQRESFRAHSEAKSRRILEEQRKQDTAWRAAVAEGQTGTKRASYEARWQFFASKHPEAAIAYGDVPWILAAEAATQEELQRVVLYGAEGTEEQRKRLRTELIRWHPDKFQGKFGRRLAPGDRERVLARVNTVSQMLTSINTAIQQQQQQ